MHKPPNPSPIDPLRTQRSKQHLLSSTCSEELSVHESFEGWVLRVLWCGVWAMLYSTTDPVVQRGFRDTIVPSGLKNWLPSCTVLTALDIDSSCQHFRFLGRLLLTQRRLAGADFEHFLERLLRGMAKSGRTKKPGRTKYSYYRLLGARKNTLPSDFSSDKSNDHMEKFAYLRFLPYTTWPSHSLASVR